MLALYDKEMRHYFLSHTGWVFLSAFLLVSGILFSVQLVFPASPQYPSFLAGILFIFLLVVPLLTMRIFTDERRFRTDQLLLCGPSGLWSIVFGKYCAAVSVFLITTLVTLVYPVLLSFHGSLEWPVIWGTYTGFILIGSAFIAIGTFVSQFSESAVGAAVLTFLLLLVTFIVDVLQPYMPSTELSGLIWVGIAGALVVYFLYSAGRNWLIALLIALFLGIVATALWFFARELYLGLVGKSLKWLSLTSRFSSFSLGVLKLDAVLYYISFSGFFLFLTVQGLEKRRWS